MFNIPRRLFLKYLSIDIILSILSQIIKKIELLIDSWGLASCGRKAGDRLYLQTAPLQKDSFTTEPNDLKPKFSNVHLSKNGTPEQNISKLLEMVGGIESIFGKKDIVILKPNAQWWNQGMTNTNAMKQFIEEVLNIPEFSGEIIIAENHHYAKDNSRGWTTENRNGDFNYNELLAYFHERGFRNVTKYHWHDAGQNPQPRQGNAGNGKIVNGPRDGDGYVWRKDIVYVSPQNRKCMMTYPIFTSAYSNITIDLINGAWKDGKYIERQIKFINFSALNHHGSYAGVTASIKNLMGVVDMTCGYQGPTPKNFFNTHYIGYENTIRKIGMPLQWSFAHRKMDSLAKLVNRLVSSYGIFNFRYTGGALGYWMANIRKPDLNIITAEVVGYRSRTNPETSKRTKTILASTDPVALDYYAAKHVLLPATKNAGDNGTKYIKYNDPDMPPFKNFLIECQKHIGGNLDEDHIKVHKYDFSVNET